VLQGKCWSKPSLGDLRECRERLVRPVVRARQALCTRGRRQRPSIASGAGAYRRMLMQSGPSGAGSQLASLSGPGLLCWR